MSARSGVDLATDVLDEFKRVVSETPGFIWHSDVVLDVIQDVRDVFLPEVVEYRALLAEGVSDYEARETVWPNRDPYTDPAISPQQRRGEPA